MLDWAARMRSSSICVVVAMILTVLPRSAGAASPELAKAAHAAYDSAVKAHEQGDFAQAAHDFAKADRLVPNTTPSSGTRSAKPSARTPRSSD